jgi:four helix bundle protein
VGNERKGSELEERTITFAVSVIEFVSLMPRSDAASVVGRQLLRCATSVGANYREANRAESKPDFIHKTSLAQKEAAETDYWLQICLRAKLGQLAAAERLAIEARELLAIFTTINRKAKGR